MTDGVLSIASGTGVLLLLPVSDQYSTPRSYKASLLRIVICNFKKYTIFFLKLVYLKIGHDVSGPCKRGNQVAVLMA